VRAIHPFGRALDSSSACDETRCRSARHAGSGGAETGSSGQRPEELSHRFSDRNRLTPEQLAQVRRMGAHAAQG